LISFKFFKFLLKNWQSVANGLFQDRRFAVSQKVDRSISIWLRRCILMKPDLFEHFEEYCTLQPSSTGLITLVSTEEKQGILCFKFFKFCFIGRSICPQYLCCAAWFHTARGLTQHLFEINYCKRKGRGKANPLQAWTGPEASRRLRLPDFRTIGTRRW